MPALALENPGVPAVASAGALLDELLAEASAAKQTSAIDPALNEADFNDLSGRALAAFANDGTADADNGAGGKETAKTTYFAVIETAARDLFDRLIATIPIDSPEFIKMWNLLDILSLLSDNGQCDPALLFWLVEELLDSQTIAGCRRIFDYLESRRERITAKHFKQKNLVILRSCNELLRRLSRAEDTAFCGRVFIFLFQSFPLGDRSSVNLRGEYHVENITSYETPNSADDDSKMMVDSHPTPKEPADPKSKKNQKAFDSDSLYALFWSLQDSFSQPLKLFDSAHLSHFKTSLDATMKAFQAILTGDGPHSSKSAEAMKRDLKRKRDEDGLHQNLETFNPKYLTSKDLFELEISDLSFRRHILVQALIIIDFILSLSSGAKERLAKINASNKSVMYSDLLDEENTKWANEMKTTISDYLKKGSDGPYFYRMVETVLARDKNWVFWKMASCPPIQRGSVSSEIFKEAKTNVQRMATNKRLRPTPMGALSMDFTREDRQRLSMENLEMPDRYKLPDLDDFKRKIADDDFEIDMPTNEETKAAAIAGKSSKTWRALRIAARSKLAAFDKIDDSKKVDSVFEELKEDDDMVEEETAGDDDMPQNREAIVVSGAEDADRSRLIDGLLQRHKGVFARVVRHTVREPREGEIRGKNFHFVPLQEFKQLRDGDRLIEYGTRDGTDYGTSTGAIDAVVESGKVPIIELDLEAAQYAKDMDFAARYVYVEALAASASQDGGERPDAALDPKLADGFDKVVVGRGTDEAVDAVSAYVYGDPGQPSDDAAGAGESAEEGRAQEDGDTSMTDARPDQAMAEAEDDSRSDHTEDRCIEVKM
ncbi:hypothetical protein HIM_04482 [Hirsutella minnesotensis 3608]|uniref:Guanylate kinase-like domain-containing protein n=1 Tax=Hirsutella minnesotensis 3608 TaxID=1043627 RepID=A0A0F7ZL58_9HYPO|nr:hypothetical protein HIM_04482 [Hirsutella minnesotensis 3608]